MKNLGNYIVDEWQNGNAIALINEYRTKKTEENDVELKDVMGKKAGKYGNANIDWAVGEPEDDDAASDIDLNSPDNTESMEDLIDKFDAEEDFFIIGQAGWGKTSTIKALCKKYKRIPVTVYLDKAVASDLGGIPVPVKSKTDKAVQEMAMPSWAAVMLDNPNTDFLLFFDEMNQAAPDVMNALMPIVLEHEICNVKFKNFFVGAAGNFERENDAVNELSGPLKSRFKPLITWEAGTARAWKSVFNYLHKAWDKKLGKAFVDQFEQNSDLFDNPREIEHKIFTFIEKIKGKEGTSERNKPEKWLRRLKNLAKEDLTRTQEQNLAKLAETMHKFVKGESQEEAAAEGARKSRKDAEMIDQNIINAVKKGMKYGYIEQKEGGKTVMYGISRENIYTLEESEINREQMERLIRKLEADGLKFKFEKDEEWKAKGYKDPNAD